MFSLGSGHVLFGGVEVANDALQPPGIVIDTIPLDQIVFVVKIVDYGRRRPVAELGLECEGRQFESGVSLGLDSLVEDIPPHLEVQFVHGHGRLDKVQDLGIKAEAKIEDELMFRGRAGARLPPRWGELLQSLMVFQEEVFPI